MLEAYQSQLTSKVNEIYSKCLPTAMVIGFVSVSWMIAIVSYVLHVFTKTSIC